MGTNESKVETTGTTGAKRAPSKPSKPSKSPKSPKSPKPTNNARHYRSASPKPYSGGSSQYDGQSQYGGQNQYGGQSQSYGGLNEYGGTKQYGGLNESGGLSDHGGPSQYAAPPPYAKAPPSLDGYATDKREHFEGLIKPMRKESYEDALIQLQEYDTVIIVDDSGSMSLYGRWAEARCALSQLAGVAGDYDENGLDIYFLNSKLKITGCKSPQDVMDMFDTVQPQGPTPIGKRLNVLVNGYLDGLDKAKRSNRQLPKPVNMLVLTDGTPTDDPQSVIEYVAKRLDNGNYDLTQLGIQFVQIGNDKEASEYLRTLDDDLAATGIRDIVDTTPYIGEISSDMIIKVLLGGINRRQDRRKVGV